MIALRKYKSATFYTLIVGMVVVALGVGISSIWLLYRTAYDEALIEAENTAVRVASLAEAVARFDIRHSAHTNPRGAWGATMSQITSGIIQAMPSVIRGEMTIGHLENNEIVIYQANFGDGLIEVARIPFDGALSQPLYYALRGETGHGELLDYEGITVLAGYAPVPSLQAGFVYKRNLADVRAPFLRAALLAASVGVAIILLGMIWFASLIRPLQRRQEENEAHLKEAQRLAQVGSWELDIFTNQLTWSDEIYQIFEIDQTRFGASYDAFLSAIHPEDRGMVHEAYSASLTTREPYQIVHRLLMHDGRIKWVEERCESAFDAEGKPLRSSGTVQDITRIKQSEGQLELYRNHLEDMVHARTAALSEAHALNELMLAAAGNAMLAYKNSGECLFANDAAAAMVNGTREKLLAQNFHAIASWRESGLLADALMVLDTGKPCTGEYHITSTFGREIWFEGSFARFIKDNSPHLLLTAVDITERKSLESGLRQAKDEAIQASKAKSEFLARMSHELRTPMNAILGFTQVLQLEDPTPEQDDYLEEIHKAGSHLLNLINELLDLSRIEAGKMAMVIGPVSVGKVLSQALQLVSPLLEARHITVINGCSEDAAVLADDLRLKQILVNLLSNAAKYNRVGGRINIECQDVDETTVRIAVRDTGQGIAPERMESLFKPFERLGAESTDIEGTGIGLSLSFKLAELMDGRITASSTLGQGSTFALELPLGRTATSIVVADTAIATANTKRARILYVEDNRANLKVVEAMIRRQPGYLLLSATTGEAGLDQAIRYQPNVILLDIHLPGMDGFAVLKALHANPTTRDIPVIALSADAMLADIERGMAAGFTAYLTKPVMLDELTNTINSAITANPSTPPSETNPKKHDIHS